MKPIIIISIIILSLSLTGCMNKYYAFDFNSSSDAQCSLACEEKMGEYNCWEASPSYQSSYTNGLQTSGVCSCYVRTCRGEIR